MEAARDDSRFGYVCIHHDSLSSSCFASAVVPPPRPVFAPRGLRASRDAAAAAEGGDARFRQQNRFASTKFHRLTRFTRLERVGNFTRSLCFGAPSASAAPPTLHSRCARGSGGGYEDGDGDAGRGRAEPGEAVRDDSFDMFRGSLDPAATIARFRCGEVACDLHRTEKALNGTFLDIRSSNEATIHPANSLLIQALQLCSDSTASVQPVLWDHMLHCWASKLEEDAQTVFRGVKGRKHIFLLNNTYDVWQLMRRTEATFASRELMGKLVSLIQPYKKSFLAETWVPLNDTLHANLDEFTAGFVAACDYQRAWKVKAELRYDLREEIVDLIVPPYEAALQLQANRSRLSVSGVLRAIAAKKKKQKKCTGEDLKKEIRALFEG